MYIHEVISAQEYTLAIMSATPPSTSSACSITSQSDHNIIHYLCRLAIPSQETGGPGEPKSCHGIIGCYARLYGCHGILGGVISASVVFSMWMIVVLEHNAVSPLFFQLGLCVHISLGIIGGLKH